MNTPPLPIPLLFACMVLAPGVAAHAAAPRAIVDATLARTDVELVGWDEAEIAYRDEFGRLLRRPLVEVVAVLPAEEMSLGSWERPAEAELAGGTPVVVELVDGQRLIGSLGPWNSASVEGGEPRGSGEEVGVYAHAAGVRAVPLERISRVLVDPWSRNAASPGTRDADPGVDDEIVFVNGDRLRGFLVEFAEAVAFDDGEGERAFALGQIAEVRLGNPDDPPGAPRVWWRGGEILDARPVAYTEAGTLSVDGGTGGDPFPSDVNDLVAAFLGEQTTVPLASLELESARPADGRRWTRGPRAGTAEAAPLATPHVALPGPMRAEWRLPPDASRFGTVLRLGGTLDDPRARPGRWADATVRIVVRTGAGDVELASVGLSRANPARAVSVELPGAGRPGRSLVIEVDPGRFGPIDDVVLLDRPMLASP